jgi:hypothetical protein
MERMADYSVWYQEYIDTKKRLDESLRWSSIQCREITVEDVIWGLEWAESEVEKDLHWFSIFCPASRSCPNCKHFSMLHGYGRNICTFGVWSSVFSPSKHVCHNYERLEEDKVDQANQNWIMYNVWHMDYERKLNDGIPIVELVKLYNIWKKQDWVQEYAKEYLKRKEK